MVEPKIDVVIPAIPPRTGPGGMLQRAVASCGRQTLPPVAVHVALDEDRQGAAATRQRALEEATSPLVAFLDDDDALMTPHLEHLHRFMVDGDYDYVYSWFVVVGGVDPFPRTHYTQPWDNEHWHICPAWPQDCKQLGHPRQTTITVLVKRDLALQVGFKNPDRGVEIDGQRWGEDYTFTLGCVEAGAKIGHLVERTWLWYHHSHNTSGQPDRW